MKKAKRRFFFTPADHTSKGKIEKKKEPGRNEQKRKSYGYTLSFNNGYFGDSFGREKRFFDGRGLFGSNVFKNLARALLYQIIVSQSRPKYPWRKK